jgi:hypothetical protein
MDYAAFTSDELEFFAENELVEIIPNFSYDKTVNFIMVGGLCLLQ